MNAKLEFALACDGTSHDSRTGQVSLFNILDDVRPMELPWTLPRLVIVCSIEMPPAIVPHLSDYQLIVRVHIPDTAVQEFPNNFSHTGQVKQRTFMEVSNLPIKALGVIEIEIILNSVVVGLVKLPIRPPATSE